MTDCITGKKMKEWYSYSLRIAVPNVLTEDIVLNEEIKKYVKMYFCNYKCPCICCCMDSVNLTALLVTGHC